MEYKIKQVSEITGLPASTLRYYEKEQLLPSVNRNKSGVRIYNDKDLDWISIISCLKATDMPIADIRRFVALCAKGDATLKERRQLVIAHKRVVEKHIEELESNLDHINFKVEYYNAACKLGSEAPLKKIKYVECDDQCVARLKTAAG
ncbi:MerR family transcriptional regulator [uncultured Robinsoniella sp.]|uniref:MerR family transcriptional regulator n=1 Tax=uncultured Robinsoniella sp. TaxID=904190 RepID=UPI00374F01FF